jgi:hypothetical protein
VDLREILVVKSGRDVPSVDLVGDDAFGLKRPECFAQGLRETPIRSASSASQIFSPRQQHAVDDQTANLRGGLQGQLRLSAGRRDSATTRRLLHLKLHSDLPQQCMQSRNAATRHVIDTASAVDVRSAGSTPSGHLLSSLVILHVCLRPWTGGPTRS